MEELDHIKENILANINISGGPLDTPCWLWVGPVNYSGYGIISLVNGRFKAHRKAYEAFVGAIMGAMEIHHECGVRNCCNPSHLRMLSHAEHMAIAPRVGLGKRQTEKTHCPSGHPYTPENTYNWMGYSTGNPQRQCRACKKARKLAKREGLTGLWKNSA